MKIFDYCPSCRSRDMLFDGIKTFTCGACSFEYYQNVATAVAAVLECDGKILLIRRANDPCKGKLDLPGGFVDPKETAEEAVKREIKEELRIDVDGLKYIGSHPNVYEYKGFRYNTCDLFFYSKIDTLPNVFDKTEIEELVLVDSSEIPDDEIAFESTRTCLGLFGRP